jgi:hypothetical protein
MIKATVKVFCDLSGSRRLGLVVKANTKTVWLKVMNGAKTYDYIKRHEVKHHVKVYFTYEEIPDEPIHTPVGD